MANYTFITKNYVVNRSCEQKFENNNSSEEIQEILYLAKLKRDHPEWDWSRKKKTDEELLGQLDNNEITEEEFKKIYRERTRKRVNSIYRSIEERVNSRPFNYFITFTTNKKYIYNSPLLLLDLVKKYLCKQNIEFVIVLEKFSKGSKGWHIHGLSDKNVDFTEWLIKNDANTDNGIDLNENFEYQDYNLYCEPIRTNEDFCRKYQVKRLEETVLELQELYPEKQFQIWASNVDKIVPGKSTYIGGQGINSAYSSNVNYIYSDKRKAQHKKYLKLVGDREVLGEEKFKEYLEGYYEEVLYTALENYIPLYNKRIREIHDNTKKWTYLGKNKEKYKYIRADLIGIITEYIKNNLDFNYASFKNICAIEAKRYHYREQQILEKNNWNQIYESDVRKICEELYSYSREELFAELQEIYDIALGRVNDESEALKFKQELENHQIEELTTSTYKEVDEIENAASSFIRPNKVKNNIQKFAHILKLEFFKASPFLGLSYLLKFVIYIKNIP